MRTKLVSSLVCMLMLFSALPALAMETTHSSPSANGSSPSTQTPSSLGRDGWSLQWSHNYGGNGHSQFAQPVGDLDGDGINEFVIGGYENQGVIRIMKYVDGQYTQVYSFQQAGGDPSGAAIADINGDGINELIVSWAYSSADGVYVYQWDGTTLTQLDYFSGSGINFIFDVAVYDYNGDGQPEVLVSNAPWGSSNYYVIGLQWKNGHLAYQTGWACPDGNGGETCMVSFGDVDNDGANEVIADVSYSSSWTYGTWMLKWNSGTESFDGTQVWADYSGNTVYGDCVGDVNGDGIPEIGIGSYGGTSTVWLFQWDGSSFQKVWEYSFNGQPVIEAVAIGDADNDGHNEFCFGGGNVHVAGWNGTGYYIKHTFTEATGEESGMCVADFDSDHQNELKACEILSATGYEYIWKYADSTPPTTTCTLTGTLVGSVYVSNVTVTLTATDTGSGVAYTKIKMDDGAWSNYTAPVIVTTEGMHTVSYYSVDRMGNTEQTQTKTFTIWKKPIFDVKFHGGLGVTMKVKNVGPSNLSAIHWSLKIEGAHVWLGQGTSGTIQHLNVNKSTTEKMPVLGFGPVTVKATVGAYSFTSSGMLFLFVIIRVK
jgi:hypothetical protein